MLLYLYSGKYLAMDFIAKIIVRGNEPCKIWIKTFDMKWHFWRECKDQKEADEWIRDLIGEYII